MKIPLLFLSSLFAASLYAQEGGTADPPAKPVPPAKVTEKSPTSSGSKPTRRYVPQAKKKVRTTNAAPATRTSPRRVVLPPKAASSGSSGAASAPGRPVRVPSRPQVVQARPNTLTENITIQLQGKVEGGPALDLAMTGIGPIFRGDVVAGDDPAIVTHSYTVTVIEGGYKVEYSIGLRLKFEQMVNGKVNSVEYREVMVSGTAIAREGKRVVIAKNGDNGLGLTLGKTASE